MHLLDLLMWFATTGILWFILDKVSGGELTNELGGLIGVFIVIIYTVIYIWIFWSPETNWSDFDYSSLNFHIKW